MIGIQRRSKSEVSSGCLYVEGFGTGGPERELDFSGNFTVSARLRPTLVDEAVLVSPEVCLKVSHHARTCHSYLPLGINRTHKRTVEGGSSQPL